VSYAARQCLGQQFDVTINMPVIVKVLLIQFGPPALLSIIKSHIPARFQTRCGTHRAWCKSTCDREYKHNHPRTPLFLSDSRVVGGCNTTAVLVFYILFVSRTSISGVMKQKLPKNASGCRIWAATSQARLGQFLQSHAVLLLSGALLLALSLHFVNVAKPDCSVVGHMLHS
jgi:hypothetical protein